MQRGDALLLPRALRYARRRLVPAVEALCLERLTVTGPGEILQAQIDADRTTPLLRLRLLHLHRHVQVPASARILTEATGPELVARQTVAVPERERRVEAGHEQLSVAVANR